MSPKDQPHCMNSQSDLDNLPHVLSTVQNYLLNLLQNSRTRDILPSPTTLAHGMQSLPSHLPPRGRGLSQTIHHLLQDIAPAVSSSSLSSRYFGFVTGGTAPAARLADYLVTTLDECLAVRIPADTIATDVENRALVMLAELLHLDQKNADEAPLWTGYFTPGSSTSNLYGIACGREYVLQVRGSPSSGAVGIQAACEAAGVRRVQILCSMGHPSIIKAASLMGLGRTAVKQMGRLSCPWHLDIERVEEELQHADTASIVSVSLGEVNSGKLGITAAELRRLRELCDRYQAWLHIDAAFGVFINALPDTPEFASLKNIVKHIHIADSITGDGHKLLNVPFDCGFFYLRYSTWLEDIFSIPKADFSEFAIPPVYFSRPVPPPGGPANPTDVGIQNARRFRALPVYANLMAYGRAGYENMLVRQTRLARGIASYVWDHPAYELLPRLPEAQKAAALETIFILILFRAVDPALNESLLVRINETGKMYAQGIVWEGKRAVRCAIANWAVEVEEDLGIVTEVLRTVAAQWDAGAKARL
ncbi:pyridoxal phosphate-dependent transferase [Aspergillus floccosus]